MMLMNRIAGFLFVALFSWAITAKGEEARSTPAPVLVLAVRRPWQGHLVRQAPDFVLYDTGLAIRRHFVASGPDEYSSVILDEATSARLVGRARALVGNREWAPWYAPQPHGSDEPTTHVFISTGSATVVTAVHGRSACEGGWARTGVPDNLCRLISELSAIRLPGAQPWTPEKVNVTLLPERGLRGRPTLAWPTDWPGTQSNQAKRLGEEVSIQLDGAQLGDVERLLKPKHGNGIVTMDRKTWQVAYEVPYPNQAVWETRFDATVPRVGGTPPNRPPQTAGAPRHP